MVSDKNGIYHKTTMVGFLLYDYDDTFPGWSLSCFMIGNQFQEKVMVSNPY